MIVNNKNIYRVLLIISFIGIVILILFAIGTILSYFNSGADRSSMLQLPIKKEVGYIPKIQWMDTINPGRPIEKQTLQEIRRDYVNAWYVKNNAYKLNDTIIIDDYYTKSARLPIRKMIGHNISKSIMIEGTTTDHELSLDFYSVDGQLAVFTDHNVEEYQRVYQQGKFIGETVSKSDYQVVVLLEDGFWRIRHFVRIKSHLLDVKPENNKKFYQVENGKLFFNLKEYKIKGINYYPQLTPWDMFGNAFDIEVIKNDFEIIKNEDLNTIRIFVQYEDFGKATVKKEKLHKLQQVLDQAYNKGLKVVVTLFDFYGNYDVSDWTYTHRHVEQIVSKFKNHKAILAWDIKNEPDLDFENRGKENVLAWLKVMIRQLRKYDPNHLITVGWSNSDAASLLNEQLDIISFHYYQDINDFQEMYAVLKNKLDKPLVIQEYGLSSSRGFWNPFGASEKKQRAYHQQFQKIFKKENMHYMSWTLYDFDAIPESVVGKLPWRIHKQKHFGFIDKNGKKKKAFEFMCD